MTDQSTPEVGIPFALPLGELAESPSTQVTRVWNEIRGTNVSSPVMPLSSPRISQSRLARIAHQLADRDRQILDLVNDHRYLSTIQVQRLVFTDHASEGSAARTARRVLARLERLSLLRSLPRRQGGVFGGSMPQTWHLAPAAARILRDDGKTYRTHTPSVLYLHHCLAVADVRIQVEQHARQHNLRCAVAVEHAAWRRFSGLGGDTQWAKPDLLATLAGEDDHGSFTDRWFIEVDLGTESLPTLLKKCAQYEAYRAIGIEQAEHGAFPLVLWLFTKPQRAETLRRAVARGRRLTPQLYRHAVPNTLMDVLRGDVS